VKRKTRGPVGRSVAGRGKPPSCAPAPPPGYWSVVLRLRSGLPRPNVPSNRPPGYASPVRSGRRLCRASPTPPPAGPPLGVPANRDPSDVPIRMGSRVAQTTLKARPVPVEAATVFSLPRARSERARGEPSSGRHRRCRRLPSHPSTAPSAGPERRCESLVEVGPDFGFDSSATGRRSLVVHPAERVNTRVWRDHLSDPLALRPAGELLGTTGNIENPNGCVNEKTQTCC
jgi:hypothetical protein